MSLSIFDDDELVESLGYSERIDRRELASRSAACGYSVRRSRRLARPDQMMTVAANLRHNRHLLTGLLPTEVRAIVASPFSATTVAKMLGLRGLERVIVHVRRAARALGLTMPPRRIAHTTITPERRAELTRRVREYRERERAEREARKARIAERRRAA